PGREPGLNGSSLTRKPRDDSVPASFLRANRASLMAIKLARFARRNEAGTLSSRGFRVREDPLSPGSRPGQNHRAGQRKPKWGYHAGGREDAERLHLLLPEITGRRYGEACHVSRLKHGNNAILAAGAAHLATAAINLHDASHAFREWTDTR